MLTAKPSSPTECQSQFLADWRALLTIPDRDKQNLQLARKMDSIQWKRVNDSDKLSEYETKLWDLYVEEWDHQEIVNRALRCLGNKRRHDWSKDYVYIFMLAGRFKFGIDSEDFAESFKSNLTRHYNLEPHHPEYEKSGVAVNHLDIQEMAVDRLSRNLWKNNGVMNMEQMHKFLPVFHGKNSESNLAKYKLCVERLKDFMINIYNQSMEVGSSTDLLQEMSAIDNSLPSS